VERDQVVATSLRDTPRQGPDPCRWAIAGAPVLVRSRGCGPAALRTRPGQDAGVRSCPRWASCASCARVSSRATGW